MSTITKDWDEEKIRYIIRNLDKKTSLNGAELPVIIAGGSALGSYTHTKDEKKFNFKAKFFNDPNTKEAAAVHVIRHEYAHYYVDEARLERYIGHSRRERSHGKDWRWACMMVGAIPKRCYNPEDYKNMDWTSDEALAAYNAEDVETFDILSFVNKWKQVPVDKDEGVKMDMAIKLNHPDAFYEIGDMVFHIKKGYGTVTDTVPYKYWSQRIAVCFKDKSKGVFTAKDICKVVSGDIIPFNPSEKAEVQAKAATSQITLEDLYPSIFNIE